MKVVRAAAVQLSLRAVDTQVGRIGQLACWEHYKPWAWRLTMCYETAAARLGSFQPGRGKWQV